MLDIYLSGAIPQMIERGRVLTASIPRDLPRDYDALRATCKQQVDEAIHKLQMLQSIVNDACGLEHLRAFKRIVAEMDLIETVGIASLSRALKADHRLNVLIDKIAREIQYPRLIPTVTTLSQNYFCIYPSFNLLCIPLLEGNFLLHLPDLYHELAHPFFTEKNDPVLEPFQSHYESAIMEVLYHFENEKTKTEYRRGPQHFYDLLHTWQKSWIKFWLEEFFCDLYGVYTLGPAFVWSHLHLVIKRGGDPYQLSLLRVTSHPCDHARMTAMLCALNLSGFQEITEQIQQKWVTFLEQIEAQPEPEYHRCYPTNLIETVADNAWNAVKEIQARIATPTTQDRIHSLLNQAWQQFWQNSSMYIDWEKQAIETLLAECDRQ
ncbi:MAG: hypothetical protein CLLPBCKN_007575 [Chroococcidiopsis cubana SAG 39.79]|uniref:Thiaminase-2/PQQC domain-containing protein n=1 Tax=Chroococcidiopsis cubana SAG 39.79 TaxID=388085 RepID=A0AB37UUY8_9CYAN|nr:hypothetical protein [Chroococcidiopsis cubana]MDZ4878140.1 hypothetical protein [Chroococcidiopsis cubana SAG 39.79]PSB65780.1 hypothetical protein C7B79_03950 [Chroococcidiopsis cubana CCALA 043]RUT14592.1 hypothetical protein DSM107010_01380 [Chroococcidiopsis cubana SAG 39.79]